MLFFQLLFSFSFYIILISAGLIQDKLFDGFEIHFDRLDTNCGEKNTPYQSFLRGVKTTSTKVFIRNSTFVVKDGRFKKPSLTIVMDRCRSKENLDTCEQYLRQQNIDMCKAIDPTNPAINKSPFYAPFEPPLKCPFNKGTYRATNITFDMAPLLVFHKNDRWYWKMKYEVVSEENNTLLCVCLDAYFTNSKSKKN